jgi:hypothetical protein
VSGPAQRQFVDVILTAPHQGGVDWADAGTGAGLAVGVFALLATVGLARRSRAVVQS